MAVRAPRLFALVVALLLVAAGCGHWQTFGYNAARTSNNPFETTLRVDNVGQLHEAWSADAPGTTPAVVSGDTVFVVGPGLRAYSAGRYEWSVGVAAGLCAAVVCGRFRVADCRRQRRFRDRARPAHGVRRSWRAELRGRAEDLPTAMDRTRSGRSRRPSPAESCSSGETSSTRYDAAGMTGCSGSPKTCQPLWTAQGPTGTPSVADGVVVIFRRLFDVPASTTNGAAGCSGSPKTCMPLWTATVDQNSCLGRCSFRGPPSIVGGRVYIQSFFCCSGGQSSGDLQQFDLAGQQGCSGIPKTCQPLGVVGTTPPGGISLLREIRRGPRTASST